jgi:hypothetical protein
MASILLSSSGSWTRPSWRPGPGNQRLPGYGLQRGGGGLKQSFQPFEGAIRCSITSSPTRLIRKYEGYLLMGASVNAPRLIEFRRLRLDSGNALVFRGSSSTFRASNSAEGDLPCHPADPLATATTPLASLPT